MSDSILPEITHLRALIERLPEKGGDSAASVIVPLYGEITGINGDYAVISSLYRTLDHLPNVITDSFPEKGRRAAAIGVIEQVKENLSPLRLARPYPEFYSRHGRALKRQLEIFPILEDLSFDSVALAGQVPSIVAEIEKLKAKVGVAEDISDATRIFLNAQLIILERALLKFEVTGVGPFRDVIFSSIGKVYIELAVSNGDKPSAVELMDQFLRVYGLFQAGGELLKLGGPLIAGLLGAPDSFPTA
jgi:hypothetical protein